MNPDYIEEIAKALRLVADALERGEPIDHVACTVESPWKEAEVEMSDEHAKLKATVAQYLAAWEEDDGVQKTLQRETMKQIVQGLGVPEDLLTGPVEYATASKSIQQARRQWEKDARRPSLLEIAMKRAEEVNPRINKETNLLRSVSVTNAHELDIAGHVILSLLQQLHHLQQKYTQAVTGSPAPFVAFTSTTGAPWVEMSSDIKKKGPDNGST